jgi:ribonuclease Z
MVYAATIVPIPDMEPSPHTSQASSKRKRIPTPDSASKRVVQTALSATTTPPATSDEPAPSWIRTMLCSKHFSPSLLEGEQAQEWRREIVRKMFSGINSPHKPVRGQRKFGILSGDTPKQTGKGAKAHMSGSKDTTSFSIESTGESGENFGPSNVWISVPAGFNKPLPRFNPPRPQCESATPGVTLAYAIVGPRLRGKFSEEKAKALGLPDGRIRGKLVRGQAVSFMVDDDNGNKVERVVRPEDCIAEGDGRGVCPDSALVVHLQWQSVYPYM